MTRKRLSGNHLLDFIGVDNVYIPERRNGKDRRIATNGKEVLWVKFADELRKRERQDLVHGK